MNEISAMTASGLSTYQVEQQIAYRLLAKQADVAKQMGDAAVQLLQSAASIGNAEGKGNLLDLIG